MGSFIWFYSIISFFFRTVKSIRCHFSRSICVCVYFFSSFLSHPFVLLIKRHFRTIDTEENLFFEKINSIIDWICRIENKVVSRICHYSSKIAWNQREFEEIIQGRWIIISIRIIKFQKKNAKYCISIIDIRQGKTSRSHHPPNREKSQFISKVKIIFNRIYVNSIEWDYNIIWFFELDPNSLCGKTIALRTTTSPGMVTLFPMNWKRRR